MKKFSVLIALALLAVAGTGYAVTCAYDNVPAATLLVPYFKVSRNGSTGGNIDNTRGVNTLVAVTNVSSTAIIVHASLWNKYSHTVIDWNIPMTGYDVANIDLRDVLNGNLNSNPSLQAPTGKPESCRTTPGYDGSPGLPGKTRFLRFTHPGASTAAPADAQTDYFNSISNYQNPAYSQAFRSKVWDSLDESGDISSMNTPGANVIDEDNPACGDVSDGVYAGDFSGYLTLDVVNYCTNWFPDQEQFYTYDAIATVGWYPTATPNTIMADVFSIDRGDSGALGNISGENAVALEFDARLENWTPTTGFKTFYGRYWTYEPLGAATLQPYTAYRFWGDGREPLGFRYGFRYLMDSATASTLQTWAIVWRSDYYSEDGLPYDNDTVNLCTWLGDQTHLFTRDHRLIAFVWDLDEKINVVSGGCPSGVCGDIPDLYVFLEAQRIAISPNSAFNPANFLGGWADIDFPSEQGTTADPDFFNQAYVEVQHSGAGLASSVGYDATLLNNQFLCSPSIFTQSGNMIYRVVAQ